MVIEFLSFALYVSPSLKNINKAVYDLRQANLVIVGLSLMLPEKKYLYIFFSCVSFLLLQKDKSSLFVILLIFVSRHRAVNLFLQAYNKSWISAEEHSFEETLVENLAVSGEGGPAGISKSLK